MPEPADIMTDIDDDIMSTKEALREINQRLTKPISYQVLWLAIAAGRVPAHQHNGKGRLRIRVEDLDEIVRHFEPTEVDRPRLREGR